jgi:hypothetical protein
MHFAFGIALYALYVNQHPRRFLIDIEGPGDRPFVVDWESPDR